jgi:hypothetical protein
MGEADRLDMHDHHQHHHHRRQHKAPPHPNPTAQCATRLTELHLRHCELGDEGGRALAEALQPSTSTSTSGDASGPEDGLLRLDLTDCGLGRSTM